MTGFDSRHHRARLLWTTAFIAASAAASGAHAQAVGTAATDVASVASTVADEIVVTGYSAQNSRAVAAKRNAEQIAEFLSGDDIGQQPDYNISDSFRRLPGVQTVFDEDEGRYVGIRGLSPNFTFGALDGSAIATAERGNRQLNMEAIPTTAVKRLEVYKSRTPDIEGNAIGGTINLVTRSAFDSSDLYLVGSALMGYSDSRSVPGKGFNRDSDDGINFRADGTFSTLFGPDKQFGILVTGSYSQKRRDQERFSPGGYSLTNGVPVSSSLLYQGYPNSVDRYGGTVKLEWTPSDTLHLALSGTHFVQDDNELRLSHQLTRGAVNAAGTSGDTARVDTAGGFVRFNDFPLEKPLTVIQGMMDWEPGDRQTLKARASYSKATFFEPSNQLQFNLPTSAANAYDYVIEDGIPTVTLDDPSTFLDPANYAFASYNPYRDKSDDFIYEGSLDYRFNAEPGDMGWGFGVGLKYRENKRDFDTRQQIYSLAPGVNLSLADFLLPTSYTPIFSRYPQLIIDYSAFDSYFRDNPANFVLDQAATDLNELRRDYVVTEKVAGSYVLGRHAGERHTLILGWRYEKTNTDVNGYRVAGAALTPLQRKGEYDSFLPSAALTYDLTDGVKLRLSYAKAIGRPNPSDLGNNETINQSNLTLSRGNPDLKPRKADNYDLSLEYYFPGNGGALTFAAFYKDIKNDIFSATTGTTVIDGATYTVTQPQNLEGSRILGLEFGLIKNSLDFLPGFLANFGVSGNVTWLDAKSHLPGDVTFDRLTQQPKWQANAALFYEQGAFKARASYAHTGMQYTSISATDPMSNRYDVAFNQLDLQARLAVGKFDVIAEARNVTDANRENFDGYGTRDQNYFGRQFWLGVAFKL